jgi:predicted HAD superfamily hydrolase
MFKNIVKLKFETKVQRKVKTLDSESVLFQFCLHRIHFDFQNYKHNEQLFDVPLKPFPIKTGLLNISYLTINVYIHTIH